MEEKMQFAILIDADNISSRYVSTIFDELDKYGFASCRRIYGNWSKGNGWSEEALLEYSIIPVQQFAYTSGKNATDMAMVIDAMDILYRDKVDGFCLVTSDSDFTRLAMRLREEKKYVLGMGESKTPLALTRACNKFIHLNLIVEQNKENTGQSRMQNAQTDDENVTSIRDIEAAILMMINDNDNKPVELGEVGSRLCEKYSDFDVRNYGYSKLSVFIRAEMPSMSLHKDDSSYYVRKKTTLSRSVIEREIMEMIEKNGGYVENLSNINDELKNLHSDLNLKDYGYSRISSFLRSMKGVIVTANHVEVKDRGED